MSIFKPWTWFQSQERKELKKDVADDTAKVVVEPTTPFKSVRLMNDTILVVLNDGTTLSATDGRAMYDKVKNCTNESDVVLLFTECVEREGYEKNKEETSYQRQVVSNNLSVLKDHEDFVVEGDNVFLEGIKLPMPALIAASFIELIEKMEYFEDLDALTSLAEQYEALKMFWMWASLNPIESSRQDLFRFIQDNDVKITKNGLLEMYRKVVTRGDQDKELVNFISGSYYKVKKNKKNPIHYTVYTNDEGQYAITTNVSSAQFQSQNNVVVGNLLELYNNLPSMTENSFTDNHTRTKTIKVGSVYKEDEDKIDLNNNVSCGAGLHVGSHTFMFSGFGDTGVLALVNPSKVRSVPNHESNKMRVSEMFIAAVVDLDEYRESVKDEAINDYSQEYFNSSVEELKKVLAEKNFDHFVVQEHYTDLSLLNISAIKDMLAQRVVEMA